MRVVHLRAPRLGRGSFWEWLAVKGEWLAAIHGADLHVYDVQDPATPVERLPDVVGYSLQASTLVTVRGNGTLHRYEQRGDRWSHVAELPVPKTPAAASPVPGRVLLSPAGTSLIVESGPISTGPSTWAVARACLLDARTGAVNYDVDLHKTIVRAGFGTLPNGREVVFLSAPSYMGVQMVDCASGVLLQAMSPKVNGFCHTKYDLSPDGRRLYSSGCWWACPDEERLYDTTPWLNSHTAPGRAEPAAEAELTAPNQPLIADAPPLPVVYEQGAVLYGEITHEIAPPQTSDGAITSVSWVRLASLHKYTTEEMPFDLDPAPSDPAILEQLRSLPPEGVALVARRIDPEDGAELSWTTAYVPSEDSQHQDVQVLPDHRVLLVNERVWVMDGQTGDIEDLGPSGAPSRSFRTAVSPSADTVFVWSFEGEPQ